MSREPRARPSSGCRSVSSTGDRPAPWRSQNRRAARRDSLAPSFVHVPASWPTNRYGGDMGSRTTPRPAAPGWLVWAALLVIYVVWGSTYLAIRVVVDTMPPLLAAGGRFATAGAIMALPLILRGPRRMRVTRAELAGSAFVAAMLLLFGNGLVSLGERDVPSGLAALIIGIVPLIVLIMRGVGGERITRVGLVGVALGFAGLAVLVVPRGVDGTVDVGGIVMLIVASFTWALGSFYSRRLRLPRDPLVSTALQLVLGGVFLLAAGLLLGEAGQL